MSDPDRRPSSYPDPFTAEEPVRLQAPVEAIASNVSLERRVAPDIAETSVIDDVYAFAARLRAGSGKR